MEEGEGEMAEEKGNMKTDRIKILEEVTMIKKTSMRWRRGRKSEKEDLSQENRYKTEKKNILYVSIVMTSLERYMLKKQASTRPPLL